MSYEYYTHSLRFPSCPISVSQVASPETNAPSGGDRKKWQTDGAPLLSVAQQTLEETSLTTAGHLTGKRPHPEIL